MHMKTEFRSFTSALWERLLFEALQRRHLAAGRDAAEARFGELMPPSGICFRPCGSASCRCLVTTELPGLAESPFSRHLHARWPEPVRS